MSFITEFVDKLFSPIRSVWNNVIGVKNQADNIKGDAKRLKELPNQMKDRVKSAKDEVAATAGLAKGAQDQAKAGQAAATGAAGQAQGVAGQVPPVPTGKAAKKGKKKMGLFGKKNVCSSCGQPQEKGWDKCPFCINMGGGAPAGGAPAPGAPAGGGVAPPFGGGGGSNKTVSFQAGSGVGGASPMQLCGWVIPLKGPHRGELHNLKSSSTIGKDATQCDVVFNDSYMSSRHATIRAANGVFLLEDHSTNGTFVNDKKVKTHELVDNDFIKFGNTLVKFKQL